MLILIKNASGMHDTRRLREPRLKRAQHIHIKHGRAAQHVALQHSAQQAGPAACSPLFRPGSWFARSARGPWMLVPEIRDARSNDGGKKKLPAAEIKLTNWCSPMFNGKSIFKCVSLADVERGDSVFNEPRRRSQIAGRSRSTLAARIISNTS
mgnify:CR=1 FL=1